MQYTHDDSGLYHPDANVFRQTLMARVEFALGLYGTPGSGAAISSDEDQQPYGNGSSTNRGSSMYYVLIN
jgi:hypothetical protein